MKPALSILCVGTCLLAMPTYSQIIADRTIVDHFDEILQQYIDSVKTMWLVIAGESHSAAYRDGLARLEELSPTYAVAVRESGTPDPYTTANLRVSRTTWGDLTHESGWQYGYGEEDWFTSETAINRAKAGISYCNSHGLTIGAFGFGWCWDPAILDFSGYIQATRSYIEYCADSIPTKILFTTGTVDGYTGEIGYRKHLGYETIRDSVRNHANWILFDYADILCYDDNGRDSIVSWNGHQYPVIASNNLQGDYTGHIGMNGALRLAKAMWWLLARIKGWDGIVTDVTQESMNRAVPQEVLLFQNYPNPFNPTTTIEFFLPRTFFVTLKIYDVLGHEVVTLINEQKSAGRHTIQWNGKNTTGHDVSSGIYFCRLIAEGFHGSIQKMVMVK